MLFLFGGVAAWLQHDACQIVGNPAGETSGETARARGVKTGPEPASSRVRIDIKAA